MTDADLTRERVKSDEPRTIPTIVPLANGCWLWTGRLNRRGYAVESAKRSDGRWTMQLVARRYLETFGGPIDRRLVTDHLCRNTSCVNPAHLEAVTDRVNVVVRGTGVTAQNARATHCKRGHAFTPENTYIKTRKWARMRICRICARAATRAWKRRVGYKSESNWK